MKSTSDITESEKQKRLNQSNYDKKQAKKYIGYRKDTKLHEAARLNIIENVINCLNEGYDINSMGERGETPLYRALIYNDFSFAYFLIDKGAKVNFQCLLAAITCVGSYNFFRLLSLYNPTEKQLKSLLLSALINNDFFIAQHLLDKIDSSIKDVLDKTWSGGGTILSFLKSSTNGKDFLKRLTGNFKRAKESLDKNDFPLYCVEAIINKQNDLLEKIDNERVNENIFFNEKPLDIALQTGNIEAIKILLDKGAKCSYGKMYDFDYIKLDEETLERLSNAGFEINKNIVGGDVLYCAITYGEVEQFKKVLKYVPIENLQKRFYNRAYSFFNDNSTIVGQLPSLFMKINDSANSKEVKHQLVNAIVEHGYKFIVGDLYEALLKCDYYLCKKIIESGIDINKVADEKEYSESRSYSPSHFFIYKCTKDFYELHPETLKVLELLIDSGADFYSPYYRKKIFTQAFNNDCKPVIDYLIEKKVASQQELNQFILSKELADLINSDSITEKDVDKYIDKIDLKYFDKRLYSLYTIIKFSGKPFLQKLLNESEK